MATRTARSFRYEYELFVEQEIENYKESIPRAAILAIGDEAAAKLAAEPQFALTEMLLLEEVDKIIAKRIRLPKYETWRKKRQKLHEEMRRPEHWGMSKDDALVRTVRDAAALKLSPQVLVAGESAQRSALFLAAHGCDVTALDTEEEALERVMAAAVQAGLAEHVHAYAAQIEQFSPTPDMSLRAVVCSHSALQHLTAEQRARIINVLQSATSDGGIHLVETIVAGANAIDELKSEYLGWIVSVESAGRNADEKVFLARKSSVSH
jgi:hypothetical protein